jgi:hypothetical protein
MTSHRPIQPTPKELTDSLLDFLWRKFYEGEPKAFAQDRSRLLRWVVLWPSGWLKKRGVSLPTDRYYAMVTGVFLDSLSFRSDRITYLPAWLGHVLQQHFAHHEEAIYDEAKSIRTLADQALLVAGRAVGRQSDPIDELAAALRLVSAKKRVIKPSSKGQLTLL